MPELDREDVLKNVPALQELDEDLRAALAAQLEVVSFEPGEQIHPSDVPWRAFYAVAAGQVHLATERSEAQEPLTLDTLQKGAHFGEAVFFGENEAPFAAYADAQEGATLFRLSRRRLDDYWADHPEQAARFEAFADRRARRDALARSSLFGRLPPDRRDALVDRMERRTLQPDEMLIEQGEPGRELFLIEEGRFRVFRDEAPEDTLQALTAGDVAGEIALRSDEPRTANVQARTEGSVLVLSASDFEEFVEDEEDLITSIDELAEARRLQLGLQNPAPERSVGDGQTAAPAEATGEDALPTFTGGDGAVADEEEDLRDQPYDFQEPWRYRLGFYPAVEQQSAMDCGAACLSTVCRYYGKRVSLNQMRRLARVGESGASMLHLMRAAQELGFQVDPFLSTYDQLAERTAEAPAIVNWKGYHWVVVYEVTDEEVTFADPSSGLETKPREEFEDAWTRYTLFLEPTAQVEEIEEEEPTLRQFFPYVRPYRRLIAEIFGASVVVQMLSVFVPLFSKFILDEVIGQQDTQWLVPGIAALSLLILGSGAIKFFRKNLLLYVSKRVNLQMMEDFMEHVLTLPLRYFERRKTGDITGRFEENRTITDFLTEKGLQPFLNAFSVIIYLGLMFYFNVWLTVVVIAFLSLNVLNVKVISPRLREAYREVFQRDVDSEGYLIEVLRGLSTVKTLGVERPTRWEWEDLNVRYVNSYFKSLKYSIASSLSGSLINNLTDVGVLFVGALMVFDGSLTIGGLVAFQLLTGGLTGPVLALVRTWDEFQEALNAVERLDDVYDHTREIRPEDQHVEIDLPSLQGHVQFENVTFRYDPNSDTNVLQNVTLQVEPGEEIAFVGRSGSGKSTLIKLLLGYYTPTSGHIYVDGFNVQDVWLPSLREQVGVVSQETRLFQGTVRDNIAHGRPDASRSEIEEAARLAYAHKFIASLPQGYDTVLEKDGSNLSGGQRQRLAIARTLLQKPNILVLDEATSALDNESERYVQQNVEEAFDCTTFTIAHRLSTIRDADEIVVLDRGSILEQGTHEELIANGQLYYYLHNEQLEMG